MSKKYTIEKIWDLTIKQNGKCLSEKYLGNHIKLQWQCEQGHIWKTMPYLIVQGSWCSVCARINITKVYKDTYIL